jgi:ribose transport system permease protein
LETTSICASGCSCGGSIWGTLIGALMISVLGNGLILLGVSDVWQYIVEGAVIIGALALDRYRLTGATRT